MSENGRYLLDQHGKPFFYLGDTAWELFHRLSREEADDYLRDRASKGYTVIQAVVLAEHQFSDPNPNGHLPLHDNDPTRPVEGYFRDVDAVVDRADALGLVIGMLPTWGDKWNKKWGKGPEIFTPENAATYGEFLGRRYRDRPIVWILGGDRPIENERHAAIIRAMAEGLRKGDGGRHLISYHPSGGHTSAEWFHEDDWLDFNMLQSGHDYNRENYKRVAADYARKPVKPCMDAEPGYEDHPAGFDKKNGYLDDHDVRKSAYWALFAGAHGHTYGCHDIWQFLRSKPTADHVRADPVARGPEAPRRRPDATRPPADRVAAVPVPHPRSLPDRLRPRPGRRPCRGDTRRRRQLRLHLLGVGEALLRGPGETLGEGDSRLVVRPEGRDLAADRHLQA